MQGKENTKRLEVTPVQNLNDGKQKAGFLLNYNLFNLCFDPTANVLFKRCYRLNIVWHFNTLTKLYLILESL